MELGNQSAYISKAWRELEAERVYHLLCEQPDSYLEAINAFLQAFHWKWRFAENIVQACQKAAHETGSYEVKQTTQILSKLYQSYDKKEYEEFVLQANLLSTQSKLNRTAEAALYNHRGFALRVLNQTERL